MDTKKIKAATTETAAAIEAGTQLAAPGPSIEKLPNGRWYLVRPDGYTVEDLEARMDAPARLQQNVNLTTADALIGYLNLFGTKAQTMVFVDMAEFSMKAVLDYHESAEHPSWKGHTATFKARKTKAWASWERAHGYAMDQATFAEFLDTRMSEIAAPAGLADVIRQLEVMQVVKFKSHQRVDTGAVTLTWEEDVNGTSKNITIPTEFQLYLPIFEGGQSVTLTAKLRWKFAASAKTVELRFHIDEMDAAIDKEFTAIVTHVGDETREHVRAILAGTV